MEDLVFDRLDVLCPPQKLNLLRTYYYGEDILNLLFRCFDRLKWAAWVEKYGPTLVQSVVPSTAVTKENRSRACWVVKSNQKLKAISTPRIPSIVFSACDKSK